MKKEKVKQEMSENTKIADPYEIAQKDLDYFYGKSIAGDEEKINRLRKRIADDFNKTKNTSMLRNSLRALVIAIAATETVNLMKADIRLIFSNNDFISATKMMDIAHNLGIDFDK